MIFKVFFFHPAYANQSAIRLNFDHCVDQFVILRLRFMNFDPFFFLFTAETFRTQFLIKKFYLGMLVLFLTVLNNFKI